MRRQLKQLWHYGHAQWIAKTLQYHLMQVVEKCDIMITKKAICDKRQLPGEWNVWYSWFNAFIKELQSQCAVHELHDNWVVLARKLIYVWYVCYTMVIYGAAIWRSFFSVISTVFSNERKLCMDWRSILVVSCLLYDWMICFAEFNEWNVDIYIWFHHDLPLSSLPPANAKMYFQVFWIFIFLCDRISIYNIRSTFNSPFFVAN